jgi:hypothetical protein
MDPTLIYIEQCKQIRYISSNDDVNLCFKKLYKPIPVAARSETWFWCLSSAGVAGSNPYRNMDICIL